MPSVELDFFYGLLGALLFRIRNEQTDYQNWIFGFVIGLFLSQALFVYVIETVGQIIWAISAMGLGVAYLLRFSRKGRRTTIDFLKVPCMALLIIYPITFYTIFPLEGNWGIVRSLTLPFLAVIYIYDRWVLKKENMKRKFVIALVAQTLLIIVLFTFALFQKAEADKQREVAEMQREMAETAAKRAQEERIQAEHIRLQLDSLNRNDD